MHSKHYICAPVTCATLHDWNQNSCQFKFMFILSHEIENSFSNEAQCLIYQKPSRGMKQHVREMRSVPHCSKEHSPSHGPLNPCLPLLIPLTIVIFHILVPLTFLLTAHIFCTTWWWLTTMHFYRTSSWCHIHHAVWLVSPSTILAYSWVYFILRKQNPRVKFRQIILQSESFINSHSCHSRIPQCRMNKAAVEVKNTPVTLQVFRQPFPFLI